MTKICSKCNVEKPINEFYRRSDNPHKYTSDCKICRIHHSTNCNPQWRKEYRDSIKKNIRGRTTEGNILLRDRLFWSARTRAKQINVPFNITKEDIVVPMNCPILEIPLIPGEKQLSPNSPTLDRMIPELGYVLGNIQVISNKANLIKSNASFEDIEKVYNWMKNTKATQDE